VLSTAMTSSPGAISGSFSESDCIGLVQAAAQLGYHGPLILTSCTQFIKATGSHADGALVTNDMYNPATPQLAPPAKRAQIETYIKEMKRYAPADTYSVAQASFSDLVDIAGVLRSITGEVTSSNALVALKGINNFDSFMGQRITCNGKAFPTEASTCGPGYLVFRVEKGKKILYSGGYVTAQTIFGKS